MRTEKGKMKEEKRAGKKGEENHRTETVRKIRNRGKKNNKSY